MLIGGGRNKHNPSAPLISDITPLYYDTYDIKTNTFNTMSRSNKEKYMNDLQIFYRSISSRYGDDKIPSHIHTFDDILTTDIGPIQQMGGGKSTESKKLSDAFNTLSGHTIMNYAESLKQLIHDTNNLQQSIIDVLAELFIYIEPDTSNNKDKNIATINPLLTNLNIGDVMNKARTIIIKLYLDCELNYTNNIKLYESIVEQKILDTTKSQIKHLKKLLDTIVS